MKLLIITQKVNSEDPILGFFHRWIEEFAKHCEKVTVICLEKGKYHLPENVKVLSLGKERGNTKFDQAMWFYQHIWDERRNYDKVFVHMNPEYVLLGAVLWKVLKKKISLWYVHKQVNPKLWIAEKIVEKIFTSASESFALKSEKVNFVGHGINTEIFSTAPHDWNSKTLVHVGRVTPIKHCEVLIEALSILQDSNKKWKVVFVGNAVTEEDRHYMKKLLDKVGECHLNKHVEFLGVQKPEAIREIFKNSFASINMTPPGGMDKAVLESWASGCPAFTSNPVFKSVFGKFDSIFSYSFQDSNELVDKIHQLVENKNKEKIIAELSRKVVSEYSVESLVEKLIKYINA